MAKSKKRIKKLKGQIKASSHLKGSLTVIKPEKVISTSADDISVSVRGADDVEHEYIYPDSTSSGAISDVIADDFGIPLKPNYQERLVENIEQIKQKDAGNLELEIGLPNCPFIKLNWKKPAQRIIKFFKAKKAKRKPNK